MSTTDESKKRKLNESDNESDVSDDETPTPHPDFWQGDVTIISSDNWSFKIARYHLQAHSLAFRDLLEQPTEPDVVLSLTDPSFERSNTVALFLLLATDHSYTAGPIIALYSESELKQVESPKRFCDKWDARSVLRRLAHFISNELLREIASDDGDGHLYIHLLTAAAILDEPDMFFNIAVLAVKLKWRDAKHWTMPWDHTDELDYVDCENRRLTDTRAWPTYVLELIPARYLSAIGVFTLKIESSDANSNASAERSFWAALSHTELK